jgi:hypothetical protein
VGAAGNDRGGATLLHALAEAVVDVGHAIRSDEPPAVVVGEGGLAVTDDVARPVIAEGTCGRRAVGRGDLPLFGKSIMQGCGDYSIGEGNESLWFWWYPLKQRD